jgi:hypothetical protein
MKSLIFSPSSGNYFYPFPWKPMWRQHFVPKRRFLRGGADKSLDRPTSRCCRTESIVSLERGVCSCAELQAFSCYRGWKEACKATRAISYINAQWREPEECSLKISLLSPNPVQWSPYHHVLLPTVPMSLSVPSYCRSVTEAPQIIVVGPFRLQEISNWILFHHIGRNGSVDIATRYGLEGPEIEYRWRARFSAPVPTGSEVHSAPYNTSTGSLYRE